MAHATILIVDDDPVSLSLLRDQLTMEQYNLVGIQSGQAAVDWVRASPDVDLVLLDVCLPDCSGIDVCRQLKQDPLTATVPIVLVSAVAKGDTAIHHGLEAGADGYLTKPIEDTALRAWVKATLRISRLQAQLARRATHIQQTDEEMLRTFARLSHAVNNPLQALYATADMLAMSLPEGSQERAFVIQILADAERVAELVAEASVLAHEKLQP